ncbi:hypothetical protein ALNOE001_08550 [Candidatus Methanobinarius endosymbioticus]|uniref:Uncharacterized protein n=1 Tax=Candidatus Methanobinarius endosymbioticus TaxID=2006182 RepID=A0A366MBG2_9EURY|nr:hypothetical protein ALNOE001_08550 [Candidatus Methanobinarius endosymbioticus]
MDLLLGLFKIYRKSYKEIRIGYTIGLLIFALLLIFKTTIELIIAIVFLASENPEISIVLQDRDLFPAIIELIVISVLYKITKDYSVLNKIIKLFHYFINI